MAAYDQTFHLGNSDTSFKPNDIAIICPMNAASAFKELVNTIPVIGCRLGKNIRLKHIAGEFKSRELGNIS